MVGANPTLLYWNADSLLANDRAGAFSLTGGGAVRFEEVAGRVGAYVEEGTTNYITNPRAENTDTDWTLLAGGTMTRITVTEPIGPLAAAKFLRFTTPGTAAAEGGRANGTFTMTGATNSFIGSVYLRGSGTVQIVTRIHYTDGTFSESLATDVPLTATWTRHVTPSVAITTAKTTQYASVRVQTNITQVITIDAALAQVEAKTYATTYADGAMGTGYSWVGTAHGSQSVRAVTTIGFDSTSRITPKQGAIVVRFRPDYGNGVEGVLALLGEYVAGGAVYGAATYGAATYAGAGGGGGAGDAHVMRRDSAGSVSAYARQGVAPLRSATSANADAGLDVWSIARTDWDAATVGVRLNAGVRASTPRVDVITADTMGVPYAYVGSAGTDRPLNGWISDMLILDRIPTADEYDTLDALATWSFDTLAIDVPPPVYLVRYKRGAGIVAPGVITVDMTYYRCHRDNTRLEDISRHLSGGEIAVDLAQPTPMSLKAEVLEPGYLENFADCIAPVMTLTWVEPDTHEKLIQTEQLGLYTVMPPTREWSAHGGSEQLDGRDVLWFLAAKITAKPYSVPTGQNLGEAIQSLCLQAGIRHAIQSTGNVMSKRRTWPPGTTHLAIANDLCKLTGFYPLFVDRFGRARGARSKRVYQMKPARHLSSADGVIVNTVTQRPDPDRICNEVTVIGNKPGDVAYRAYRLNNDPASPTSTVSLGYTDYAGTFRPTMISKFEEDTGLTTQDAVDQRADLLMDRGSTMFVRQTVWTLPVIDWAIHDLNELDILTDSGNVVSAGSWRWDKLRLGTGVDALVEWEMAKLQPWADVS